MNVHLPMLPHPFVKDNKSLMEGCQAERDESNPHFISTYPPSLFLDDYSMNSERLHQQQDQLAGPKLYLLPTYG